MLKTDKQKIKFLKFIMENSKTHLQFENFLKNNGRSTEERLNDIAKKHAYDDSTDSTSKEKISKLYTYLKKQLSIGTNVEKEHTDNIKIAEKIALDHLDEDPKYYQKLKKIETNEMTGADSSGSFVSALNTPLKRPISKIHNMNEEEEFTEATDASSSGAFDVPLFGTTPKGRRNPLKIDGVKSINKSRAVKDKNFPKWGGPGGVFIKIKEKCKKFPYCNQGDINTIEVIKEAIDEISKETKIPKTKIEEMVLNEINKIFI